MPMILIVDDDPTIRDVVERYLRRDGYDVAVARDGQEALSLDQRLRPDLIILDLMLPKIGGLEVCRRLQIDRRVPIIMLTARGEEHDRIVGLGIGADDYVVKPFSPRELTARVTAVLRRTSETRTSVSGEVLALGRLHIDPVRREVRVNDEQVSFTAREFDLLYYLASHPERVFTREQLLDAVWGYSYVADESAVTVHVHRLREKIEDDPARPRRLITIWGVGYRFTTE